MVSVLYVYFLIHAFFTIEDIGCTLSDLLFFSGI